MQKDEIWLRLMATGSLEGKAMSRLVALLANLTELNFDTLVTQGFKVSQARRFLNVDLRPAWRWLQSDNHFIITFDDPCYPQVLRVTPGAPGVLMVWGQPEILARPQLAIIGSRNNGWYGKYWADYFAQSLSRAGLVITSGLARGIDGIAHRGALAAEGQTVAVLGSGIDVIYPQRHNALAAEIVQHGGCLVSEFPCATPPWPANFPRRNRIISGLSLGVLVVEATIRSGSMTTVRCGLDQGRDIFAVPGALNNPGSEGPNWLIQQGAVPVVNPEDILQVLQNELQMLPSATKAANYCGQQPATPLPFPELLANVEYEVTPVDVVAERAGQPVPETVAQLLELELAGWIAAVPGGYVRLRRASHVRRSNVFI